MCMKLTFFFFKLWVVSRKSDIVLLNPFSLFSNEIREGIVVCYS